VSRRIVVVGTSGSGKTTFARELAGRLGLPHVELDALHHGPNWYQPSADEFRATVEAELFSLDGWVCCGAYHHKLGDLVPSHADTLVWLDLPLRVKLWRLLRRTVSRLVHRTELWQGNRESLHGAFWGRESLFGWMLTRHLEDARTEHWLRHPHAVRLRSSREVRRWLEAQTPSSAWLARPGASPAKEASARPEDST
jgi:adenylate kinase family enzyme